MTEDEYHDIFDMRMEKEHQETLARMRQIAEFVKEINTVSNKPKHITNGG